MTSLFIGDSITEGFPVQELLPAKKVINRGISGSSSSDILERMSSEWLKEDPDQVFICLGTNDLVRGADDDSISANLSDIITRVEQYSSQTPRVYLTSLFPTHSDPVRTNQRIYHLNTRIHLLCEYHQHHYLHLNVFFQDLSGRLREELTDDGLHLNRQGYELWARLIEPLV